MKKYVLLTLIIGFSLNSFSQSWTNSNSLIGDGDLTVLSSTSDLNDNTIIYGSFTGTITPKGLPAVPSNGGKDYYLAKFDATSNLQWVKAIGSDGNEWGLNGAAAVGSDGSIYITGSFKNTLVYGGVAPVVATGVHDIFLAKYDTDGNNIWGINAGTGPSYNRSTALQIDNDENILLGGYFLGSNDFNGGGTITTDNGFKDYFYAKFKSDDGRLAWSQLLKSIDTNFSGFIYSFEPADEYYVISGVFADSVQIGNDTIVADGTNYYDTHTIKTDTSGNISWYRQIKGALHDYSYSSTIDGDDNIYVTGYYNSPTLTFDSTETETIVVDDSQGTYDFFVAKYNAGGTLQWVRVNGGAGADRLIHSHFYDGNLWVTGYFTDELPWGGNVLSTAGGLSDTDMFYGSIDPDGNYRTAARYSGLSNSTEEGLAIFSTLSSQYAVIRSNSIALTLGDSTYANPSQVYFIAVGNLGCLPITVTLDTYEDVTTCFGDSTGEIEVAATGGFGNNYQYSIDNGFSYQSDYRFRNVPAGDYVLTALDEEGCFGQGPDLSVVEPDEIVVSDYTFTDTICYGTTGSISVTASGGTGILTYSIDSAITYPYISGNISNLSAGIYDVVVKDANNCFEYIDKDTIVETPEIVVNSLQTVDPICNGVGNDSLLIDATGGLGVLMFSTDGGATFTHTNDTITSLGVGTYSVFVKDSKDCYVSAGTAIITDPAAISVTMKDIQDVTCFGGTDGSLSVGVTGGLKPYEFTIDDTNYQTDSAFTDLAPGTYTVKLMDDNACTGETAELTVSEPGELTITLVDSTNIIAGTPGDITVSGAGGTTPYTFTLKPGDTQQTDNGTFAITSEGTYYIVLDDANGCNADSIAEITILHVGIGSSEFENAKLYPNPAQGIVNLELNTDKAEMTLEIVSVDGRLVLQQQVYNSGGQIQETLDLSDLKQGMYIIKLDNRPLPSGLMIK